MSWDWEYSCTVYRRRIFVSLTIGMVALFFLCHPRTMDKMHEMSLFRKFENKKVKSELSVYLSDNSNCKSMFTINSDGQFNTNYSTVMKDIRSLEYARQGNPVSYSDVIHNLGKYLSKIYQVNLNDSKGNDQNNLTGSVNEIHYTKWPYVPCEAHKYSSSDFKACSYLYQNKTNRPLRISFVGDSMIRAVMKKMVLFLKKDLHLRYLKDEKSLDIDSEFGESKFKSSVVVIGDGIELSFYWASYLDRNSNINDVTHQGANDLLQNWLDGKYLNQNPIPDILYIGSGTWLSFHRSSVAAIEEFLVMIKQTFIKLKILSFNVRVLWHVHPNPGKRYYHYVLKHNPSVLSWMNQVAFLIIKGSNIWFWDTLAVLTSREKKECATNQYETIKLLPSSWNCQDPIHPGVGSVAGGVNMLLNMACNHILNINGKCCS